MSRARPFVSALAAALLLLGVVADTHAQADRRAAVRTAANAISGAEIYRDAMIIGSDANLGRATPSAGFDSAAAHVERALREIGVRPLGDNGTYRQYYSVTRITLDTARVAGDITHAGSVPAAGHAHDRVAYGDDMVLAGGLFIGEREGGVVYLGDLFTADNATSPARAFAGQDVRGKWLLVHAPRAAQGARVNASLVMAVHAKLRGAHGFLMIPNTAAVNGWAQARTRALTYRDLNPANGVAYSQQPLPQVTLSRAAFARLLQSASVTADALLAADSTRVLPAAFTLPTRFRLSTAGTEESVRPFNVVGIIEGAHPQLREEYIAVTSHLDGAVGRGANTQGDSIFNAADDNASGSAGNIALARALMRAPRTQRSIVLIWDSGEEVGLWGTRHLAYSAIAPKIVALVNIDMIGRTRTPGTSVLGEDELTGPDTVHFHGPRVLSSKLDELATVVTRDFVPITFDRRFDVPDNQFFYPRSDASPYLERGIPYAQFQTGLHVDYHRQTDEAARLDPRKLEIVTRAAFVLTWLTADDPVRPRIDRTLPPHVPVIPRQP
jgi:hypothetical protein